MKPAAALPAGPLLALLGDGPGAGGGIARYNTDWLQALAPRTIHAVLRNAHAPQDLLRGGEFRIAPGRLAFVHAAWQLARSVRPQVIFCGHLHFAPLAAWLCRRTGARLWLQLHGVEAWPVPSTWRRRAAESASLVSCVSRYTRSRFLSWARVAPERVRVLPNTVGAEFVPQSADQGLVERLGLHGQPRLLTVGRLSASERYKGHDQVLASLPRLCAQFPELQYLIAGDGDDRERLQGLAVDLGVQGHVHFLGHVAHADLPELYRQSNLYVMPSRGEGFGIVYLEAMCCGTPALGLHGDGSADPLADGALGCLVEAPEQLADALLHCLHHRPARAELAQAARSRFGPDHYGTFAQACLQRLLEP